MEKNHNSIYTGKDYAYAAGTVREILLSRYSIPDDNCVSVTDTLKFRLLQQLHAISKRAQRIHRARNIAAVILAILFTAGVVLASNVNARDILLNWIKIHVNEEIMYFFEGNPEGRILQEYSLSYIPVGFEVFESSHLDTMSSTCYFSEDMGDMIVFTYSIVEDGDWLSVQSSVGEVLYAENVSVRGLPGEYYQDKTDADGNTLVWFDAESNIVFQIDSTLDKDAILKIAESVRQKSSR